MKSKAPFPESLHEAIQYFSDPDVCVEFLAAVRWPNGPQCPACESLKHSYLRSRRIWKCLDCGRQYSAKLGTVFEDSPIRLEKWMAAVWLIVNCKNGVSSHEIARALKVTQKSAWFMLHRIRLALQDGSFAKFGPDSGPVEVDETFVGGKVKNMHKSRRIALQRARSEIRNVDSPGHVGKTIVMGLLDRSLRQVRAKVVPNVKRDTLQREVLEAVEHGSRVYTDEWSGYIDLHTKFIHDVVNKVNGYVDGQVHVNGIENFWSLFKRGINGTYVSVEPFHLFRYLDEQMFRFNHRSTKEHKMTDADRFLLAMSQVAGKRLTYAELTGKVGETPF